MLNRSTSVIKCLPVLLLLICAPALAFAAGSGHGHPSIMDTLKYWANFLLFVGVLTYLLKGVVTSGWAARRQTLLTAVEAGTRELEAAEARLAAAQEKVEGISSERARIEAEIAENGKQEAARVLEEATARAKRISAQALDSIEAERRSTEVALRRELAEVVIRRARERIINELDGQTDEALRTSALEGLSGLVQ